MPGLSGYQLCRLIRGISSVPVLVMNAQMGAEDMAYRMGADAFIPKPFDLEDLWADIGELLLETCSLIMA